MDTAAHHYSPASEYMALVQPERGHQAASNVPGESPPAALEQFHVMADTMAHAQHGPQEPPPPDHLYADAQIDHGGMHGTGGDIHAATLHADVSAAAAAPVPEPPPVESHDHGPGGA